MSEIQREDISQILAQPVEGNTKEERNINRKQAVEQYLQDSPDYEWLQGSVHSMILSDLESYPEWEK